jgi:hypothetical protein
MMSQDAMSSALLYGGAMALVGAVSGRLDLATSAVDGALMGAASIADDMTHQLLDRQGTIASSMLMMGAWFAGLQAVVKGDGNYGRNAAAGAATSLAVELYY